MKKTYRGWSFQRWCALDPNDDRKIIYTVKGIWKGKKQEAHFSSEDSVDTMMLFRIQNSIVESIELVGDEWHVSLIC